MVIKIFGTVGKFLEKVFCLCREKIIITDILIGRKFSDIDFRREFLWYQNY